MRTNAPRFTGTRFHFLGQPCQEENKVQQIKTSSLKSLSSRDQLGKGQKLPNKLQQLYGDEGKFGTDTCSHDVLMCFAHTLICVHVCLVPCAPMCFSHGLPTGFPVSKFPPPYLIVLFSTYRYFRLKVNS